MAMAEPTLRSVVLDDLVAKITSGHYRAGSKLPAEVALCQAYGVSRPVVRSALARLRELGFVVSTRGVGTFVCADALAYPTQLLHTTPLSADDLLQCWAWRCGWQAPMAQMAARHCTERDHQSLDQALAALQSAGTGCAFWQAELELTLRVAQATHNRFYLQSVQTLAVQLTEATHEIMRQSIRVSDADRANYSDLVQAIKTAQAQLAQAIMQLITERSYQGLLQASKESK